MTISICIPTYNRAQYLEYLLPDLYEQISKSSHSFEINLSDNCSVDHTSDVISAWQDRLNINYFKQNQTVDPTINISTACSMATGEFSLYLADDDFLDIYAVEDAVHFLQQHPATGILFAPWKTIELRNKKEGASHSSLTENITVTIGGFRLALLTICTHYFFTEVFVARTEFLKNKFTPHSEISFFHSNFFAHCLATSDVCFYSKPFYFQSISYFQSENHQNTGHDWASSNWDCYRGGLECLLGRITNLTADDQHSFQLLISHYTSERLLLALKIRLSRNNENHYENYLLAMRICAYMNPSLLPVPINDLKQKACAFLLVGNEAWTHEKTDIVLVGDVDPRWVGYLSELSTLNIQIAHEGIAVRNPSYIDFSQDDDSWPDFLPIDPRSVVLKPDHILAMI